jgi:hypothetical protein
VQRLQICGMLALEKGLSSPFRRLFLESASLKNSLEAFNMAKKSELYFLPYLLVMVHCTIGAADGN